MKSKKLVYINNPGNAEIDFSTCSGFNFRRKMTTV
jgi:hypothetical protein